MRYKVVFIALIAALALLPATANAGRCHIGGSGKKTICLCPGANGRDKSAPMILCGKRR